MNTAIWWIRRDLRLADNPALAAAMERAAVVIPLFILDPRLLDSPGASAKRTAFLFASLRALDASLRQRGSGLIVRRGDPLAVLHNLCQEVGASEIFAEADVTPFARNRDHRVGRELPLNLSSGLTVHPPETLHKADGEPYTVYSPFSRMWRSLPLSGKLIPAPERLPSPPLLDSLAVPDESTYPSDDSYPAGEAEALRRLDEFSASAIQNYAGNRDRLDISGTSGLSPYLRFGILSARQAAWAAHTARWNAVGDPTSHGANATALSGANATDLSGANATDLSGANATDLSGADAWLNELIWREFYLAIMYHFPHVRWTAFRPALRNIPWRNDPGDFNAWTEGHTGYPVVDAAMRQLRHTGWMHNRARMITASFLTKDLLVDWRWGERYFMQRLVDGDPAANNGGWQWTAGTGTDAAPYFRVFNPVLQGARFDPLGKYVRRWVPELAAVPEEFIHTPWKMTLAVQRRVGCTVGKDYPAPLVDHNWARQRVLAAYQQPGKMEKHGK